MELVYKESVNQYSKGEHVLMIIKKLEENCELFLQDILNRHKIIDNYF